MANCYAGDAHDANRSGLLMARSRHATRPPRSASTRGSCGCRAAGVERECVGANVVAASGWPFASATWASPSSARGVRSIVDDGHPLPGRRPQEAPTQIDAAEQFALLAHRQLACRHAAVRAARSSRSPERAAALRAPRSSSGDGCEGDAPRARFARAQTPARPGTAASSADGIPTRAARSSAAAAPSRSPAASRRTARCGRRRARADRPRPSAAASVAASCVAPLVQQRLAQCARARARCAAGARAHSRNCCSASSCGARLEQRRAEHEAHRSRSAAGPLLDLRDGLRQALPASAAAPMRTGGSTPKKPGVGLDAPPQQLERVLRPRRVRGAARRARSAAGRCRSRRPPCTAVGASPIAMQRSK